MDYNIGKGGGGRDYKGGKERGREGGRKEGGRAEARLAHLTQLFIPAKWGH